MNDFLTMVRGDSASWLLSATLNGAPYNVAGCLIWFSGKRSVADGDVDAVFMKTLGGGVTVTDAANGLVTVTLSPTDTETLPSSRVILDWDLQVKTAGGAIYTVALGKLTVFPDVTRSR